MWVCPFLKQTFFSPLPYEHIQTTFFLFLPVPQNVHVLPIVFPHQIVSAFPTATPGGKNKNTHTHKFYPFIYTSYFSASLSFPFITSGDSAFSTAPPELVTPTYPQHMAFSSPFLPFFFNSSLFFPCFSPFPPSFSPLSSLLFTLFLLFPLFPSLLFTLSLPPFQFSHPQFQAFSPYTLTHYFLPSLSAFSLLALSFPSFFHSFFYPPHRFPLFSSPFPSPFFTFFPLPPLHPFHPPFQLFLSHVLQTCQCVGMGRRLLL